MYGFFGVLTIISGAIFTCGLGIAATEDWEWRGKWHEKITIGCAIAAIIFSTILNIIS